MPKPPTSVDAYLARFPEAVQTILAGLRATIRKAVPRAEESMSYGIPTYKLDGKAVLYFAGWKQHVSVYPTSAAIREQLAGELDGYSFAKDTLRFPLEEKLPLGLVAKVARLRLAEVEVRAEAKSNSKGQGQGGKTGRGRTGVAKR